MSEPTMSAALQETSDAAKIEAVARDYVEGWYTGSVERMDRCLHDKLVKRILEDGSGLREVTKARMLELTAGGGGENPVAEFEIIIDDISQEIATVRVLSPEYLDYLHVARTTDGWKIVNVLFRNRDV